MDKMEMLCSSSADLAWQAAELLGMLCEQCIRERGIFTLAISGGRTPLHLFRLLRALALEKEKSTVNWSKTRVFWVDERCVPRDDPRSNFFAAWRNLFACLPECQELLRMPGELLPEEAAARYTQILRAEAGSTFCSNSAEYPRLDCILLGMGADGHTAGLFPGSSALHEEKQIVTAVQRPDQLAGITLTFPVLNAARFCIILVSGKEKAETLWQVWTDPEADLPICRIKPFSGQMIWIADADAVGLPSAEKE